MTIAIYLHPTSLRSAAPERGNYPPEGKQIPDALKKAVKPKVFQEKIQFNATFPTHVTNFAVFAAAIIVF